MRSVALAILPCAALLAAPVTASATAKLSVDPAKRCYREKERVMVIGEGFTPNGKVVFSRDDRPLGDPLTTDPSGAIEATLDLPSLISGRHSLTYVVRDETNTSLSAEATLLVAATRMDFEVDGSPFRRLHFSGTGFTAGDTVFAHVVRLERKRGKLVPVGATRNVTIGDTRGACGAIDARGRLFPKTVRPGVYRAQFDNRRHYAESTVVRDRVRITIREMPKQKKPAGRRAPR
jgi:hypothetical protein